MKWQNSPMAQEQPVAGYNVVHIIGQGGQAQVYLAEREHDGLRVALKVLNRALRNDRVFLERFVREYKLVASLDSAITPARRSGWRKAVCSTIAPPCEKPAKTIFEGLIPR